MKRAVITSIALLGLLVISCEKEEERSREISIGETCHMLVHYYDTTVVGGYNSTVGYSMDIDCDGTGDIEFTSEIWGSPGLGQHPSSSVRCLHGDTTFFEYRSRIGCAELAGSVPRSFAAG
jgi:hypothetical protein